MRDLFVFLLFLILLLSFNVRSQQRRVHLDSNILTRSKQIMIQDSLEFNENLNKFLLTKNINELKEFGDELIKVNYRRLLIYHSNEILNKLGDLYKIRFELDNLYSFLPISDSIKFKILNRKYSVGTDLAKARLGDSISKAICYNYYKEECNKKVDDYDGKMVAIEINTLIDLEDLNILKKIFKDMNSYTIMVGVNRSNNDTVYSTMGYAFIIALKSRFPYEPIFNSWYMDQYFDALYLRFVNKRIKIYYKQVEDFVMRKYGIKVKINTPYLLVGWPDYGFY